MEYWSDGFPISITPPLHYSITPIFSIPLIRQRLAFGFAGKDQNDQTEKINRTDGSDCRGEGAMRRSEHTGEERTGGGKETREVETETLRRGADRRGKQFGKINAKPVVTPAAKKPMIGAAITAWLNSLASKKVVGTRAKRRGNKSTERLFCPNDRRQTADKAADDAAGGQGGRDQAHLRDDFSCALRVQHGGDPTRHPLDGALIAEGGDHGEACADQNVAAHRFLEEEGSGFCLAFACTHRSGSLSA